MFPILSSLRADGWRYIAALPIGLALIVSAMSPAHASVSGVLPDYYSEPGNNPFRDANEMSPNEAVDPFTGGLQLRHLDVLIPGNGGLDIKIYRIYNSNNVYKSRASELDISTAPKLVHLLSRGMYGMGWTMHFGRVIRSGFDTAPCDNSQNYDTTDNPVLERSDGSQQILFNNNTAFSSLYITRDQWAAYCIAPNQGLLVISPDGVKYTMNFRRGGGTTYTGIEDTSWYTTRIEDRNGNWINIEYDTTSLPYSAKAIVKRITTSDNRQVDFTYADVTNSTHVRLSKITVGAREWNYYYTSVADYASPGYYQLTKVELPAGSGGLGASPLTWLYEYWSKTAGDPGHRILKKVTYPFGATTNYDYAYACFNASPTVNYLCSQLYETYYSLVVSTKTTGGRDIAAGTWTYSYAPSSTEDVTTVIFPGGQHVYKHFGSRFAYSADPTNGGSNLWKIGLLKEKLIYDGTSLVNREIYTWDAPYKLSNEEYVRPPFTGSDAVHLRYYDTAVYMPVLTKKEIIRDGTSYATTYSNFKTSDASFSPQTVTQTGQGTRTWNYTYFPRATGQNIVNLLEDETLASPAMTENANTLRTFDSAGNLKQLVRHGVVENYTYHASGDLNTRTNARQFQWSYSGYRGGIPQTEIYPEGVTLKRTVNEFGEITSVTNGRNYVTNYTYDGLSRITSIDPPGGTTVTVGWSATGRTVTRGTYQQAMTLDGLGRPSYLNTNGVTQDINYNALGHKIFESYYSSTSGDTFASDVLGRIKSVQHADSTRRTYSYLSANRVTETNERGFATTLTYRTYADPDNAADRVLMREDAPEAISTVFVRDPFGNPRSVTQGTVARQYGYNTSLFLISETHPETGVTAFGRDAVGNMTSRKVGASATTTYVYDGLNRLKSVDYPGTTPDVALQYDGNSNPIKVTSTANVWSYAYDPNDNLTKEILTVDGQTLSVTNTYNGLDQLTSVVYPSTKVVSYNPDALGRPTTATPYLTGVTYHPNGQPKQLTYANGRLTTVALNARQWISGIATAGVATLQYGYDGRGNVLTITDALRPQTNRTLGYDGVDRLKTANGVWGSGTIGYDTTGNINSMVLGSANLSYTYVNHRLASVSGARSASFSYDVYGNVAGNGRHSFVYDDAGNLRSVAGASSAAYLYDGNSRRVRVQKDGVFRYYLYAKSGKLIGEYDDTGFPFKEYAYLGDKLVGMVYPNPDNVPPTANAGTAQTVNESVVVTLTGSGTDSDGTIVGYSWTQTAGPTVTLTNPATAKPTFTAPLVLADTPLSFALTVRDNDGARASASVTVTVRNSNPDNDADGLPDAWELAYFGNLLQDANGDPDGDGLTNLQESQAGADPTKVDTDGDGTPDATEVANGTNPALNEPAIMVIIQQLLLSD